MEEVLDNYRYLALAVGTFFEGETAILLASSLIHKGLFGGLPTVLFAFAGSFVSDWLYYLIGRVNGKLFLERRPALQARVEPVTAFFAQNQLQILLSYRFLYGFRVIIPLIIGMSGLRPSQYLFYTIFSGLIWASSVTLLGYTVGQMFGVTTEVIQKNLPLVILVFSALGLSLGFMIKRLFQRMLYTP
ncbi:MAG TPA: DedA family protein [Chryseosolibacter sp.]|nr:DedA family protein [Chryseosolibacter sp.]